MKDTGRVARKPNLRDCPFCGLPQGRIKRTKIAEKNVWKVRCLCGASIAWFTTRQGAVKAWNGEYPGRCK